MTCFFQSYLYLVKNNLIKQIRSYSFLIVIGLTLFLGYFCVPAAADGYQVFYIGGVRGIYDSAWLGGMAAMLSTLLLWLFGFYMLRSQISEDIRLKIAPIIASTPVSKLRYMMSKMLSNFIVLITIEIILLAAFMAMQLLRGEDRHLRLWEYMAPFLLITAPSLFLLAALTILFDVVPGLKGSIGNVVFFTFWIFLSVISIAIPHQLIDLFGFDTICLDMARQAAVNYPHLEGISSGGSFGYYLINGEVLTFKWQGVNWTFDLLIYRLIWIMASVVIILFSSLLFNRFKKSNGKTKKISPLIYETQETLLPLSLPKSSFTLSPVVKEKHLRLSRLIKAELQIMLSGLSIWWFLVAAGFIAASFLIPINTVKGWLPLLMILPLSFWSQMGTREKYHSTRELVLSSCPPLYKWLSVWLAGIIITFLISIGVVAHLTLTAQWTSIYCWGMGILFIPTLALVLGSLSKSKKLFEVIYILWWYLGPINDIPYLDFLGTSSNHGDLYLIFTIVMLAASLVVLCIQENFISQEVHYEK